MTFVRRAHNQKMKSHTKIVNDFLLVFVVVVNDFNNFKTAKSTTIKITKIKQITNIFQENNIFMMLGTNENW